MTKKEEITINPEETEIAKTLDNYIEVWQQQCDRAKEYFDKAQVNLTYAIQRKEHWIKTGKLLPVDAKK